MSEFIKEKSRKLNVAGNYDSTLHYAGTAIDALNSFYITNSDNTDNQISLTGHGEAAEIRWWKNSFATDSHIEEIYHNILDIRNETAIAMLALRRWDDYHYNNHHYNYNNYYDRATNKCSVNRS